MIDTNPDAPLPVETRSRSRRPEVRPVVQITCELAGASPEAAAAEARAQILNWLRDKQSIPGIPEAAWAGRPFEIDATQGRPVTVDAHDHVWALRYDNPSDGPHGRIWRTESIVGVLEKTALIGLRLTTITREWGVPIPRSVPRVVFDLAESPGLRDYGVPLRTTPWRVESEHEVESLVELLEKPERTRPVFVVSEDSSGVRLIDAELLASLTAGLGHVVTISDHAAWALSDLTGKRLSVYGQGVRTYLRGFNRADALFDEHPVATAQWLMRRFPDPRAFVRLLARQSIEASVTGVDLESRLPSFGRVREWASARRLVAARQERAPEAEMLTLYEESNRTLEQTLKERDADIEELQFRQMELEEQRDEALRQSRSLRSRIAFLEEALEQKQIEVTQEYPDSYEGLDDWVSRYFGDSLILLARAARAAKKAEFDDLRLVCDALGLLAGPYRAMRRGELARREFERMSAVLGVDVSPTGDQTSLMRWRSEYEVSWGKDKRFLDLHLKKGNSREPKNCLRIYFFWDDDAEQVIVGHLPGHLTTAVS